MRWFYACLFILAGYLVGCQQDPSKIKAELTDYPSKATIESLKADIAFLEKRADSQYKLLSALEDKVKLQSQQLELVAETEKSALQYALVLSKNIGEARHDAFNVNNSQSGINKLISEELRKTNKRIDDLDVWAKHTHAWGRQIQNRVNRVKFSTVEAEAILKDDQAIKE